MSAATTCTVFHWIISNLGRFPATASVAPSHLWFRTLRQSPWQRSACSPWPAARHSSRHTESPACSWRGSPRSCGHRRPGPGAPSHTRTELTAVREEHCCTFPKQDWTCQDFSVDILSWDRIRLCWTEETGISPPSRWLSVRWSPSHRALSDKQN